jgi:uncharacterized protein
MRLAARSILVSMLFAMASAAIAAPLEDADAAFKRRDYSTAVRLWRSLADQGDTVAQTNLGVCYEHGRGVPRDYVAAAKWFRKAADQGDAIAQYNLGFLYDTGIGVARDFAEAAKWYVRGADQGDAVAQANLGAMYAQGQAVPRDNVRAYMWSSLAAAQGDPDAVKNRNTVAKAMTRDQIAEAQRLAREWKPTK